MRVKRWLALTAEATMRDVLGGRGAGGACPLNVAGCVAVSKVPQDN